MKVKTNLKAGFNVGHEVNHVVRGVAHGALHVLNGVGEVTAPVVRETGRIVSNPHFWTWPFGSNKN